MARGAVLHEYSTYALTSGSAPQQPQQHAAAARSSRMQQPHAAAAATAAAAASAIAVVVFGGGGGVILVVSKSKSCVVAFVKLAHDVRACIPDSRGPAPVAVVLVQLAGLVCPRAKSSRENGEGGTSLAKSRGVRGLLVGTREPDDPPPHTASLAARSLLRTLGVHPKSSASTP